MKQSSSTRALPTCGWATTASAECWGGRLHPGEDWRTPRGTRLTVLRAHAVFPSDVLNGEYLERNPAPGTEGDVPQPPFSIDPATSKSRIALSRSRDARDTCRRDTRDRRKAV